MVILFLITGQDFYNGGKVEMLKLVRIVLCNFYVQGKLTHSSTQR